jgi:hypothetical protein
MKKHDELHRRIAGVLGWTVQETQSLSLRALRDIVRQVSPLLASEIDDAIESDDHVRRNA